MMKSYVVKKTIPMILSILLIIFVFPLGMFGLTANAVASGTTGDCTWSYKKGVFTISGNGKMADYNENSVDKYPPS